MSRHAIELERTWGTTDEDCRAFIVGLYRRLYGRFDNRTHREVAGPFAVGRDSQEIVVDAEDYSSARLMVEQAAREADPAWRRLYRIGERAWTAARRST